MPPFRLIAVPALLVVALTAACSAGTSAAEPPATTAPPTSTAPTTSTATATPGPSAPPTADVQRLTVVVAGSSVTGDTGTVDVRVGRPVQLTVTSDVADEVHVHGVDVSADVPAGGTITIDFVQAAPGRFEVELEGRDRVLTRLQVS